MRRPVALLAAILLTVSAGGCASMGGSSAAPTEVTVFAAASLRDALGAAASAYRENAPGVTLTLSFDASSALRTQIEQGAPADVFASADMSNPTALADTGLTRGPVVPFAANHLAIVVPAANPASIRDPRDLARDGVRVVGAGEAVPISRYVEACLVKLEDVAGYPAGYAAAVQANVVSREDNVRAALAKVELGEADAAFVYATDAVASDAVDTIAIPAEANVEATYGAVVVGATRHPAEAAALVEWLAGDRGAAVLARFGFEPPAR
ncbi:MAG TPA: molybdate ABC transporter substrate-binding protein [Candidatus Limnocylindrales bacterium]